jgi:UV DNA damage endonuclease
MVRYGYACINMELGKQGIRTGRTMTLAKWERGGLQLASDIALENAMDLLPILEWNEAHGIRLFRIGSELFPRWDHYELNELPEYDLISEILFEAGEYARQHGHRLTTHPGPFHILGSPYQGVVEKAITGLERHSELFDMLGYEPSFDNLINIHIGATYGDKDRAVKSWLKGYDRLSDRLKARLVLENDDKASMYSVRDLYEMVHKHTQIPITFDYWHHTFNTGDLSERDAFFLARETWDMHGAIQCTHYSESRRLEYQKKLELLCEQHNIPFDRLSEWPTFQKVYDEFSKIKEQAHADYILRLPNTYDVTVDVEVEAKAKEQALIQVGYTTQHILQD